MTNSSWITETKISSPSRVWFWKFTLQEGGLLIIVDKFRKYVMVDIMQVDKAVKSHLTQIGKRGDHGFFITTT